MKSYAYYHDLYAKGKLSDEACIPVVSTDLPIPQNTNQIVKNFFAGENVYFEDIGTSCGFRYTAFIHAAYLEEDVLKNDILKGLEEIGYNCRDVVVHRRQTGHYGKVPVYTAYEISIIS